MEKGNYFNSLRGLEKSFFMFVDALSAAPAKQDAILEHIGFALSYICPSLHIGKVEAMIESPPNVLYPEGMNGRKLLYSDGVVNVFNPVRNEFMTEEKGKVIYEFYWKNNGSISEEKQFWTSVVGEMLFLYMGRARISSMLQNAMGTDMTTGLPNLSMFIGQVEEIIHRGRIMDYAAAYFNIRNFKYINQLVSFQDGDAVMRQYAGKVTELMGPGELIARLGGDNYVVLIRKEGCEAFLDQLDKITVTVATGSGVRRIPLSVRVGVYQIDRPLHVADEIMSPISVAQQICRENKNLRRVYYTQDMAQKIFHEKKVVMDFSKAIEEGQFKAYYQPKVSLSDGRLCGAEALARWEQRGRVIEPSGFVPMLEKDGTICRLDYEMLRQCCEFISSALKSGRKPVVISVNMSRWHLKEHDFVDRVSSILREYDLDPGWIEIEVTETVDYEEYNTMLEVLTELKKRGFHTAIDDFGTGYSSLTMLHRLEVDVIKLDQSFLWERSEKSSIMIRNIIKMSKELGVEVLAEGVETTEHRDFLIESGCDMAQGFLYSKPMKRDEFEKRAFL
ncbi:MAG: EAL domain-containing protein [Lachnospiraceae bacterium]|nr:EAL domain-containing protein [Lachnospiraceae bacterium]